MRRRTSSAATVSLVISGSAMMALMRTDANVLGFTMATCIVSFVVGLLLFAAGFVLIAIRPGTTTAEPKPVRALLYFWVGQNVQAQASGQSAGLALTNIANSFTPQPETLVDPREAVALRQLIAGVREGRVDLTPTLNASSAAPVDAAPITDIVIPPLTIEPLAPFSGAQGERQ